jgi:hypothetical protein
MDSTQTPTEKIKVTIKKQDKKITTEQVEEWLGIDKYNVSEQKYDEILEILVWFANGEYDPKVMRKDILSMIEMFDE